MLAEATVTCYYTANWISAHLHCFWCGRKELDANRDACCCRYATKERSRLHSCELQELCAATGHDLSESEAKVALQAISKNGNMFIDFNEFVSFWVSPDVATAAAPVAADVATAVQQ